MAAAQFAAIVELPQRGSTSEYSWIRYYCRTSAEGYRTSGYSSIRRYCHTSTMCPTNVLLSCQYILSAFQLGCEWIHRIVFDRDWWAGPSDWVEGVTVVFGLRGGGSSGLRASGGPLFDHEMRRLISQLTSMFASEQLIFVWRSVFLRRRKTVRSRRTITRCTFCSSVVHR